MDDSRFRRAIAAIDAANADDPHTLEVRGRVRPKEQAHSELVTEWVDALRPDASAALRLAARAHHVRRWEIPRNRFPSDRPGYLRWRKRLQQHHAEVTARLLCDVGYAPDEIERVQAIVQKRRLGSDPEVQAFEDALCLTFLETQLTDFAAERDAEKSRGVLDKTLRKMSSEGRSRALTLPVPEEVHALLRSAIDCL